MGRNGALYRTQMLDQKWLYTSDATHWGKKKLEILSKDGKLKIVKSTKYKPDNGIELSKEQSIYPFKAEMAACDLTSHLKLAHDASKINEIIPDSYACNTTKST